MNASNNFLENRQTSKFLYKQAEKVHNFEKNFKHFVFSDIYWVPSMFRVRAGVKISSGFSGWIPFHCSIQREIQIQHRGIIY